MTEHHDLIREQFTKQAVAFATAPSIRDEDALRLAVELVGTGPEDTVLDVACGPGLVACAFAERARAVTGIDLTPAMIDLARKLQAEKGLGNVAWRIGDVVPLPFADGSFSIVVCRYSLHHFEDPRAVVLEMARVCAPGGRVLAIDVTAPPDPARAAVYNRMEKLRDPSHVRALALAELEALLREAGLAAPRKAFYRLEVRLEDVLARSSPEAGAADEIRRIFADSLADDALGVGACEREDGIHFAYPIAALAAGKKNRKNQKK